MRKHKLQGIVSEFPKGAYPHLDELKRTVLHILRKDNFQNLRDDIIKFMVNELHIPRKNVAQEIGLTEASVSRILRQRQRKQLRGKRDKL